MQLGRMQKMDIPSVGLLVDEEAKRPFPMSCAKGGGMSGAGLFVLLPAESKALA